MKSTSTIVLGALAGASLAPAASADLLVSNLDESASFPLGISSVPQRDAIYASMFVTGADATEVLSVTARLNNPGGHGLATYEAFIYTDDGTGPGSTVATFDTTPTLASGAGTGDVGFASMLGIALDPDTAYWLGIRNTTGSHTGWWTTVSTDEASPAGWSIDDHTHFASLNGGDTWSNSAGVFEGYVPMFSIEGNTVPAPGALALLGAGGVIASRRRRG